MKFSIKDFFSKCDQIRSKLLDIIFDNFENCGLNILIYLQKLQTYNALSFKNFERKTFKNGK